MRKLIAVMMVMGLAIAAYGCGVPIPSLEEQKAAFELENPPTEGEGPAEQTASPMFGRGGGGGMGRGGGGGGMGRGGGGGGGGGGMGQGGSGGGGEGGGTGQGGGREEIGWRPHRRLPPRWNRWDQDGNGRIDPEEFTGIPEEFQRMDMDQDGYVLPREALASQPLQTALSEHYDQLDANKDNQIFKEEWEAAFSELDADGDRALSLEELRQAHSPLSTVLLAYFSHFDRQPPGSPDAQRDGDLLISEQEWQEQFQHLDRLEPDGRVLRDEMAAAVTLQRHLGFGTRSRPARGWPQRFGSMDANGDGRIDHEEFQGAEEEWARLDQNQDGQLSPKEVRHSVPWLLKLAYRLPMLDRDGDGTVDTEEWHQMFFALDDDGSLAIEREELRDIEDPDRQPLAELLLAYFSDFDEEGDDAITEQEWKARFLYLARGEPEGRLTVEKLRGAIGRKPAR